MKLNFWQWLGVVLLVVGIVWWQWGVHSAKQSPTAGPQPTTAPSAATQPTTAP